VRQISSPKNTSHNQKIPPKNHQKRAQIASWYTPQPSNPSHSLLLVMPCTIIPHVPINSEWVETLVGLRLNIPNKWWPGFRDGGINRGKIAAKNLDLLSSHYFQVELDDEPGAHYAMRYDSVLLYADDEQPGFSQFCLPSCCPANPDDEIA
jgi:hypothetical protein